MYAVRDGSLPRESCLPPVAWAVTYAALARGRSCAASAESGT